MVTADSEGALGARFMPSFKQNFAKYSVANFFNAGGYLIREWAAPWISGAEFTGGTMEKEQGGSIKTVQPDGAAVLQEVVQMTGLPEDILGPQIAQLLGTPGEGVSQLTLDQLRSVLLSYLETVNDEMIESESAQSSERH
jgi:hypothetical protein